jgi:hypothetical protein
VNGGDVTATTRLLAVWLVLLAAACAPSASPSELGAGSPADQPPAGDQTSAGAGRSGATAEPAPVCGDVESLPPQAGEHLLGDQPPPTPYSSIPPTSGWHSSGALDIRVQPPDDPLTEPEQVSVLEAGAVVVSYRDIPRSDYRALRRLVTDRFDGRVALTSYDRLEPGQVAMTAWTTLQVCDRLDMAAVTAFAEAHAEAEAHRH